MIALLFKASIIIALLWLFYKLVLERESFFGANRLFLVSSLILAFCLPFVALPPMFQQQGWISQWFEPDLEMEKAAPIVHHMPIPEIGLKEEFPDVQLPPAPVAPVTKSVTSSHVPVEAQRDLTDWLMIIYYFGAFVFSLNLLTQIGSILFQAIKSQEKIQDTHYTIINSPLVKEPCSFFNFVFINPESYDFETYEQILSHEAIHVRKLHTLDLLLAELAAIVLWFNPLIWIFRKEVEKNIEFQTDDLLLGEQQVRKDQYQMSLLRVATYNKPLAITTNYNQSLIKKRILKMSAKKSSPHSYWKYAFVAPMLFSILLILNKPSATFAKLGEELSPVTFIEDTPITDELPLDGVTLEQMEENEAPELAEAALPEVSETDTELESVEEVSEIAFVDQLEEPIAVAEVESIETFSSDCQSLLAAIQKENLPAIKRLLDEVDPNCSALITESFRQGGNRFNVTTHKTPLLVASQIGNISIAKLLVRAGANPNISTSDGESPINTAYSYGYNSLGDYLSNAAGKDAQSRNEGRSWYASSGSNDLPDIAEMSKKDINENKYGVGTPLIIALKNEDITAVKWLLAKGADINKDSYGVGTPLIVAIKNGDLVSAKYLVSQGADLDVDSYGIGTALIVATKKRHEEIMNYLIRQGADLNVDSYGVGTALMVALNKGDMRTAKYLINQGADLNVDSYGVGTALIASLKKNDYQTAQFLISKGADLNEDSYGIGTALIMAVKKGDERMIQYLIQEGADLNVDSYGIGTALIVATKQKDYRKMEYLIAAGADVNEDSYGIGTALIVAVKHQDHQAARMLLAQGADINENSYGIGSALSIASKKGDQEMLNLLLSGRGNNSFSPTPTQQREY